VARDRQRAKQRKARRGRNPGPARSKPTRADVPGELEHASGEVDEFEAALVAGADGEPVEEAVDEPVDERDAPENGATATVEDRPRRRERAAEHREGILARFLAFLKASWAELQRVQWPDRRQVAQATAVVLGFVVIAGLYLGLADVVAKKIVDFII
jgi:preprotein translocase SecE subunit